MSISSPSEALNEAGQIEDLKKQLHWAHLKIQLLEDRLRLQRIAKYGPGSEKLNSAQLQLLELEPGVSDVEVRAESEREPLPASAPRGRTRSANNPGRQEFPTGLPRVEKTIACPAEHCSCPSCGKETSVIGYVESEQLDLEPAKYLVLVTKREKRACRHCPDAGVVTASLPVRIVDKCLASDRTVIDTIVAKYSDHLPLYRQSSILARETGIDISRATMDGWVMRVGDLLIPIAAAMSRELLRGNYIQADETPVDVQLHNGSGQNHQAYLWQYGKPGGSVVFDFRLGRAREGPKHFLGGFAGILQTDGYAAYEGVGGPKMAHAACWAHSRRKFVEVLKLNPGDRPASRIVASMDALFAVDAQARDGNLTLAARYLLRVEQSAPLLEQIKRQIERGASRCLALQRYG